MANETVLVDRRLVRAADRMYDAIHETIAAFGTKSIKWAELPAIRFRLQRAVDAYDEAMTEEVPCASP